MDDRQAILAIEDQFNHAWNRHDAEAMVAALAEDVQFVTVHGVWKKSRADYLELISKLHQGPFKASLRETLEIDVRFLGSDVAQYHSRFRMSGETGDSGQTIPAREGVSLRVVQKRGDHWVTVAVQNTDIASPKWTQDKS